MDKVLTITDIKKTLTQIWQATLDLSVVREDDDFLAIGGHSLLMVEVKDSIAEDLQIEISMIELFNHLTINELSRFIYDKLTNAK